MQNKTSMNIFLSGGGTIGSVSPLLAIYQHIAARNSEVKFVWVGTRNGPEQKIVASYNLEFEPIFAGKLRRYASLANLIDPIFILFGFFQSLLLIARYRPAIILSAGGFVSVPLVFAGWLLRVPALIHQQDVEPGLANKLMAPFAKIIPVTFSESKPAFPAKKTRVTGNPVRADILTGDRQEAIGYFSLEPDIPTVLVIGGGTGATTVNKLVVDSLDELVIFCQVIHLTGGRMDQIVTHRRYHGFEFLTDELKHAYAAADLVVSRAGMSALTELAMLGKPTIVIPISESHQESNASAFLKNNAVVLMREQKLTASQFAQAIEGLLGDPATLRNLSRNIRSVLPTDATERISSMLY